MTKQGMTNDEGMSKTLLRLDIVRGENYIRAA
jgi:hypothetical protein